MCNQMRIAPTNSMYRRARNFYLTRAWGMNMGPITLASILDLCPGKGQAQNSRNHTDQVSINSVVTLLDLEEHQRLTLTIVKPQDSNPGSGAISILSALGSALMNKTTGDTVRVPVFGSTMRYRILQID